MIDIGIFKPVSTTNRDQYRKPPLFKRWSLTFRQPPTQDKFPEVSTKSRYSFKFTGLARSPFVLTEHITSLYVYIYIVR